MKTQIGELRKNYHETIKLCKKVDEYFSMVIILLLVEDFILGLTFTYGGLRRTVENFDVLTKARYVELGLYIWGFISFFAITYIISSSESTHSEVCVFHNENVVNLKFELKSESQNITDS